MTTEDELEAKATDTAKTYLPRIYAYLVEQNLASFKTTLSGVIQLEEKSIVRTAAEKSLQRALYDKSVSGGRLSRMRNEYFAYIGEKPVEVDNVKS